MADAEKRKVGDRGQVTLPKRLRDAFDIHGGDEVTIREEGDRIVIEKPTSREELAEGYRRRADRHRELADETATLSREANDQLGDAPEWKE
ncbi:AbrB/MazE/SpoVT family DNA-binding domain-containing protein [Natrinema gari]|uniref:Transcriptional regulator, AbrB family protein n=1 Tax=Natrinema gari JCM 14663 TaxID=1230459 RepID=L9YZW1_9EURY|nr:AbrB/MazE/SpoVT family DNA-binding domain-containing protein [Natrinema gari]ELY79181.1 transcriptional regulator, AbrB family protein [Natrinema gari JCM 14663]